MKMKDNEENDIVIFRIELLDKSNLWSTAKIRKRSVDFMLILDLNDMLDLLANACSVHWYGHVLRVVDGNVLRSPLEFEARGERKKGRLKMTWMSKVEKKAWRLVSVLVLECGFLLPCGESSIRWCGHVLKK